MHFNKNSYCTVQKFDSLHDSLIFNNIKRKRLFIVPQEWGISNFKKPVKLAVVLSHELKILTVLVCLRCAEWNLWKKALI